MTSFNFTAGVPGGGWDLDPYEANTALAVREFRALVGASGTVDFPVTLTRSDADGGLNHLAAVIHDPALAGRMGPFSPVWVLELIVAGTVVAEPDSLDFGSVAIDSTAVLSALLSNPGTVDVEITDLSVSGNTGFFLVSPPSLPTTLGAAGPPLELEIGFAPTASGSATGTLHIAHDGFAAPLFVPLAGTGVPGTTAIDPAAGVAPRGYALHPSRPNPFNPPTAIPFDLLQAGMTTLRIYDVRGHLGAGLRDIPLAPPMKRAEAECTIPTRPRVCHSWNFRPQGA